MEIKISKETLLGSFLDDDLMVISPVCFSFVSFGHLKFGTTHILYFLYFLSETVGRVL